MQKHMYICLNCFILGNALGTYFSKRIDIDYILINMQLINYQLKIIKYSQYLHLLMVEESTKGTEVLIYI